MANRSYRSTSIAICLAVVGMAMPLAAQDMDYLDALSDSSVDEAGGLQAAREQASRGEYLEALATVERVLADHPKSREGRLIHALYLCKIDDVQGGMVELSRLKKKEFGEELLDDAKAVCTKEDAS